MEFNPVSELWIFFGFFICGSVCGMVFDVFRAFRKNFKLSDAWVIVTDALFWLITTPICAFCVFYLNDGMLRAFVVMSFFIGVILYFLCISRVVFKVFLKIITIISQIIKLFLKILLTPLKFSYKMLLNAKNKFNSGVQS